MVPVTYRWFGSKHWNAVGCSPVQKRGMHLSRRCVPSSTLLLRPSHPYLTIHERMNNPDNASPPHSLLSSLFQKKLYWTQLDGPRFLNFQRHDAGYRARGRFHLQKIITPPCPGFFPTPEDTMRFFCFCLDGPDVFPLTLLASCLPRPSSFVEYTRFFTTADPAYASPDPDQRTTQIYD